jgi:hypothetical protein
MPVTQAQVSERRRKERVRRPRRTRSDAAVGEVGEPSSAHPSGVDVGQPPSAPTDAAATCTPPSGRTQLTILPDGSVLRDEAGCCFYAALENLSEIYFPDVHLSWRYVFCKM